jgi:hypothetical protein
MTSWRRRPSGMAKRSASVAGIFAASLTPPAYRTDPRAATTPELVETLIGRCPRIQRERLALVDRAAPNAPSCARACG